MCLNWQHECRVMPWILRPWTLACHLNFSARRHPLHPPLHLPHFTRSLSAALGNFMYFQKLHRFLWSPTLWVGSLAAVSQPNINYFKLVFGYVVAHTPSNRSPSHP